MNFFNKGLLEACKLNQKTKIYSILNGNPRMSIINYVDKHGMTPLMYMCKNNLLNESYELISKYGKMCNVHQYCDNYNTCITYAIFNNMTSIVILLLKIWPDFSLSPISIKTKPYQLIFKGNYFNVTLLEFLLINYHQDISIQMMNLYPELCYFDKIITIYHDNIHHNILSIACALNLDNIIHVIMTNFYNNLNMSEIDTNFRDSICVSIILYFLNNDKMEYIDIIIKNGDISILKDYSIVQLFLSACKHNKESLALKLLPFIHFSTEDECYYLDQQIILEVCNCGYKMDNVVCELIKKYPYETNIQNVDNLSNTDSSPLFHMIQNFLFGSLYLYIIKYTTAIIKSYINYFSDVMLGNDIDMIPKDVLYHKISMCQNKFDNICDDNKYINEVSKVNTTDNVKSKNNQLDNNDSLECIICYDNTNSLYVSIKCGHITRLCNDCYKEYKNMNECSICRRSLNLIKCYST